MLAGEREREREREMIPQVLLPYLFIQVYVNKASIYLLRAVIMKRTESAKGDHLSYGV